MLGLATALEALEMDSVHSLARSGRTATTKRSSFAHVESLPPRLSAAAGPTFRWRRWGSVITSLPDALSESGTAEMLDTFGSARSTETDGEGAPLIMPLSVPWGASNTADPDAGLSQPLPRAKSRQKPVYFRSSYVRRRRLCAPVGTRSVQPPPTPSQFSLLEWNDIATEASSGPRYVKQDAPLFYGYEPTFTPWTEPADATEKSERTRQRQRDFADIENQMRITRNAREQEKKMAEAKKERLAAELKRLRAEHWAAKHAREHATQAAAEEEAEVESDVIIGGVRLPPGASDAERRRWTIVHKWAAEDRATPEGAAADMSREERGELCSHFLQRQIEHRKVMREAEIAATERRRAERRERRRRERELDAAGADGVLPQI